MVYITGSFNNWTGKVLMIQSDEPGKPDEFFLTISIKPDIYYFKYIVDEKWRVNPDYQVETVNQVQENVVEVKRPVFEDHHTPFADSDEDPEDNWDDEEDESSASRSQQRAVYSTRVRGSEEYQQEPPKIPPHLNQIILHTAAPNPQVDPYVLPIPLHVVLNHHYTYKPRGEDENDISITAVTQRFKTKSHATIASKYVTTVYLAPKPKIVKSPSSPPVLLNIS